MSDNDNGEVAYRCWCEHDGCDWTRDIAEESVEFAQTVSTAAMVGHGLDTGHHETKRERVETDGGEDCGRGGHHDDLARYLGEDFDPEDVGQLPDDECDYCGRQAATGEHGCCRWCRDYLHGVAVGAGVSGVAE